MSKDISSNIFKLYVIKIAKWFMLTMPIVIPFYESNHLTGQDVFLLQAIYSVATLLLEIPSGYFADAWGRKNSMVIGTILGTLGFGVYCFSYGFWGFLLAEIVLGIGQSFISGSDSALLYDTLLEKKKEKDYLKYEGRITSFGNFAEAFAGVITGFIVLISIRHPYYFQTGIAFMAIPAALMLVEPHRHKQMKKLTFKDVLDTVHIALVSNKQMRWNIIYSAVIGTSTLTMAWFVQYYFKLVNIPLPYYGTLWTLLNLAVGVTSMFAYKIEYKLGQIKTIILIAVFIPLGYIALAYFKSIWAIGFIFIFYFVRGIATPVLKDYINRITSSEIRATVLSVRNFIIRLNFAAIGPFLGWTMDAYSLQEALLLAGITFITFSSIVTFFLIKTTRRK